MEKENKKVKDRREYIKEYNNRPEVKARKHQWDLDNKERRKELRDNRKLLASEKLNK